MVPHTLVEDDGSLGEWNDVTVASIEKKFGINASPTATLKFGENSKCLGWLIGEENRGMSCMFQMMNEATAIVGFFEKWDEVKRVKRDIKRTVIEEFDELDLVKPVTGRFMELAEVKFK